MRCYLLMAVFTLLMLPRGVVAAEKSDPAIDAATVHSDSGKKFFEAGRFDLARIEFDAAYRLSNEPDLLYNVALCWEREGALRQALELLVQYAEKKPDDKAAKTKIEQMRADLATATPKQAVAAPSAGEAKRQGWLTSRRIVGVSLLALGAAALVATIGLGASTEQARQTLLGGSLTYAEATDTASRAQTTRGATIGLGVLGGIFVIGGIPLVVLPTK